MEHAMSELPLALFTVLASAGAGAFIALAIASFSAQFDEGKQAQIDRATWIPVAVVVVGFIAASFHLTNPLNAVNVFSGLGRSPLANEVCMGMVFAVVAIVYAILANAGKLNPGSRKGLLVVTAVLALCFGLFMGMAYLLPTVQSWNSWAAPVEMIGLTLVGGAATGALVLAFAEDEAGLPARGLTVMAYLGAALTVIAATAMAGATGGMSTMLYAGSALVAGAMPALVCGCVALVAGAVCTQLAAKRGIGMAAAAVVLVVVGALALRLAFYAMQLSVGLSVL